jgi:hypothetical protein
MTTEPSPVRVTPGAEENGLANMVADLVRQNLEAHPERLADLAKLDLWLGIDARDVEVGLTLVFEPGRLTVVDGILPRAEAVLTASSDAILELSLLRIGRSGLPVLWDAAGRKVANRFLRGELQLRGTGALGRLLRVTRLLSVAENG